MKALFVVVWLVATSLAWLGLAAMAVAGAALGLLLVPVLVLAFLCLILAKVWAGLCRGAAWGWELICRGA